MGQKIVIVGGVAGGATAAARIRRLDEQAEILVFERSGYISYANCGLPYYIGDVIADLPGHGHPPGQKDGLRKGSKDREGI